MSRYLKSLLPAILSVTVLMLSPQHGYSQTLTVDPALIGATIANGIIENDSYTAIKNKQNAIEVLQTTTVGLVNKINTTQEKIYKGLLYVSSTVKNAYQVYECLNILKGIYEYEAKMISEAQQNPLALIFAVKFQQEMVVKSIEYYNQIQTLILKENDDKLLMDAGARTVFLTRIVDDLRAIEGYAIMSYFKVHWAVINGIIQTLNPFAGFVNKDAQIVKDVLNRCKF